jgi:MFS family permease
VPDVAVPLSSQRSWALALVAANFVGFTLLLTAVPVVASARGLTGAVLGVVVAVVVGLGVVADAPVGHAVATWGVRPVVVVGACVSAAACLAVAVLPTAASVVIAAPVIGVANALLVNPLLTALAASADEASQVRTQLTNAGVQRAGALVAALAVSLLLTRDGGSWLFVVCAAVYLLIAVGAPRLAPVVGGGLPDLATTYRHSVQVLRRSREVQLAALMNVVITTFAVTGGSFVPLLMGARGASSWAVGAVLAAREVVAVAVAWSATRHSTGLRVVPFVAAAGTVGALSLMACWLSGQVWFLALAFAAQGAALCACIAATNLHTVWGTAPADRLYGFAATSFTNRLAGIAVPVLLGAVLARADAPTVVLTGGAIALTGVLGYLVLARRAADEAADLPRG